MHDACKTGKEKAWLAVSLATFFLHRLMEATSSTEGMWVFETLMIVLSFPFGLVAMLFLAIGADALREYMEVGWILDWSTLLVVGYIQWFWVLPEIRRNSKLVSLNLTSLVETASPVEIVSPVKIVSPVETAPPSEIASPAPPYKTSTLPEAAPVAFNVADFLPSFTEFTEFDEAGLTALDRVLRQPQQTPTPALPAPHATPSGEELIFPSVLGSRA